jgi:hypothetical protein
LSYVVDGDPKRWLLTSKFIEKNLRSFAMGTASANKDFEIRDRFAGLGQCPAPKHEQDKADADRADEPPYTLM